LEGEARGKETPPTTTTPTTEDGKREKEKIWRTKPRGLEVSKGVKKRRRRRRRRKKEKRNEKILVKLFIKAAQNTRYNTSWIHNY